MISYSLIKDSIKQLKIKPSEANPISKFDVKRICSLFGKDVNDHIAIQWVDFLQNNNALGSKFSTRIFARWWRTHMKIQKPKKQENQYKSFMGMPRKQTNSSFRSNRSFDMSKHRITEDEKSLTPDLKIWQELEQELVNRRAKQEKLSDNVSVRRKLKQCVQLLNGKNRSFFQDAYNRYHDEMERRNADVGRKSSQQARRRLNESKMYRAQKLDMDIDFIIRNQMGNRVPFVMQQLRDHTKSKSPLAPRLHKSYNRRAQEILETTIM